MDGWDDITRPIAPPSAQRVTLGWRLPGKGSPGGELVLSAALLRAIGWQPGETRVRIKADTTRTRLALVPDEEGKLVCAHGAAGSLFVIMPWVFSGKRPCAAVAHRLEKLGLVLDLPVWARGAAALDKEGEADVRHVLEDRLADAGAECQGDSSAAVAPGADTTGADGASLGIPDACARSGRLDENPAAANLGVIWTPARRKLLRELWVDDTLSMGDVQQRLQALPGPAMSKGSIYSRARTEQLETPRPYAMAPAEVQAREPDAPPAPPAPPPPPPPRPAPSPAVVKPGDLRAEILALRDQGKRGREIADETGAPLSQVLAYLAAADASARAAQR